MISLVKIELFCGCEEETKVFEERKKMVFLVEKVKKEKKEKKDKKKKDFQKKINEKLKKLVSFLKYEINFVNFIEK